MYDLCQRDISKLEMIRKIKYKDILWWMYIDKTRKKD